MELCKSADLKPTFVFISAIGSILGDSKDPAPEEVCQDWLRAEPMGYTQSKLIAERLIATTAATTGVKSVICRIGQLGGVLNEEIWNGKVPPWPEKEWLPAMLASSIQLSAVPSSLGLLDKIDWVPADLAAAAVCELMSAASAMHELCQIYHITNPQPTAWKDLLPKLEPYANLQRVTLADWVALLRKRVDSGSESVVPAIGLIEFFERACAELKKPMIDCSKSLTLSPTLKKTQRISVDVMERWIGQWRFS